MLARCRAVRRPAPTARPERRLQPRVRTAAAPAARHGAPRRRLPTRRHRHPRRCGTGCAPRRSTSRGTPAALARSRRGEFGTGRRRADRSARPGGQRADRSAAHRASADGRGASPQASAARRPKPTTLASSGCRARRSRRTRCVPATERIWDFYFELFGQRQSAFGEWLLALRPDRARLLPARVHRHRRVPKSIPAPPPFSTCAPGSPRRRSGAASRSAGSGGSSTRSR